MSNVSVWQSVFDSDMKHETASDVIGDEADTPTYDWVTCMDMSQLPDMLDDAKAALAEVLKDLEAGVRLSPLLLSVVSSFPQITARFPCMGGRSHTCGKRRSLT